MTSPEDPQVPPASGPCAATGWLGDFSFVFAARILSSAVTFLTVVLVGRFLGRTSYGELVVLLSLMKVAAELVGPALDTALVRFGAGAAQGGQDAALPYYSYILRLKLRLAAAILLIGVVGAVPLARVISPDGMGGSFHPAVIALAFAGAAATILWAYAQTCFQAQQRFGLYAGLELFTSLLRLALVAGLIFSGNGYVLFLLAAYAIAPALAALAVWHRTPVRVPHRTAAADTIRQDVLRFAKWTLTACLLTSVFQRADVFLLVFWGVPSETLGDYGAAVQLTLAGDLVILTLFNVLLPKASTFTRAGELREFLRRFRVPAILSVLLVIPIILLSQPLVSLTFGPDFLDTGWFFSVLLVGAAFAVGCAPAGAALYGMGRTRSIATLECIKLFSLVIAGSIATVYAGAFGVAWAVSLTKGALGIATYVIAYRASGEAST